MTISFSAFPEGGAKTDWCFPEDTNKKKGGILKANLSEFLPVTCKFIHDCTPTLSDKTQT